MRIFYLVLAFGFLCGGQTSSAQETIATGDHILGGGFNFLSQKNAYPLTSSLSLSSAGGVFSSNSTPLRFLTFGLSPYLGKSLGNRWILGFQSDYSYTRYKREFYVVPSQEVTELVEKSHQFGFGVFARYSVNPGDRLQLFGQPSVGYNLIRRKVFDEGEKVNEDKANFLRAGASLGLLYELNDNWRLLINTGIIEYLSGNSEDIDEEESRSFSSFATNLNLTNIRFGVELKL